MKAATNVECNASERRRRCAVRSRLIWTIKVIRLRYRSLRAAPRFAELSEIFYELLRARGDGHSLGEIKRVSANVKAQFPADGYELMEDVDADADEDAFPVSRRGELPRRSPSSSSPAG